MKRLTALFLVTATIASAAEPVRLVPAYDIEPVITRMVGPFEKATLVPSGTVCAGGEEMKKVLADAAGQSGELKQWTETPGLPGWVTGLLIGATAVVFGVVGFIVGYSVVKPAP